LVIGKEVEELVRKEQAMSELVDSDLAPTQKPGFLTQDQGVHALIFARNPVSLTLLRLVQKLS